MKKILALTIFILLALAGVGWAAIAFNAAADGGNATGTSLTFSYTCSTGDNRLLIVAVVGDVYGGNDDVTGVTYGGDAMTFIGKRADTSNTNARWAYLYYLIAPKTGANNVVVSCTNSHFLAAGAADYTGVAQTTKDNSTTSIATNISGDWTTSLTTNSDNCWTVLIENSWSSTNVPPTAGTGLTRRTYDAAYGLYGIFDSNAPITPAGQYDMTTGRVAGEYHSVHITASFAPAGVVLTPTASISAATSITQTTLTGVGSSTDGGGTVTERGILLKAGGTPTLADYDFKLTSSGTSGAFAGAGMNVTGLSANTAYTARGFATNEIGTGYSSATTYTTLRNPGNFYLRADGTAATITAATGPSSTVGNCMNVTVHNAGPFVPGDTIYISDKGGSFTPDQGTWAPDNQAGLIIPPNSGTAGNPIVYAKATGESPTIDMSWVKDHDGSIWTDLGSGKYETNADFVYYARVLWEDGVALQVATSTALSNGRWFYEAGRLYYKPTSGTPADHKLESIWWTDANWSPYAIDLREKSYIEVSGIIFTRSGVGVGNNMNAPVGANSNIKVHDCTFNYSVWGIYGQAYNAAKNATFSTAEFYNNILNYCNSGISVWSGGDALGAHTNQPVSVEVYSNVINHLFSVDATNNWNYAAGGIVDHEAISFQDARLCSVINNIITCDLPLTAATRAVFLYAKAGIDNDNNLVAFNKITGGYDRTINFSGETGSSAKGNIFSCNVIKCPITTASLENNLIYINLLTNPATDMNYICNNTLSDAYAAGTGIYLVTDSGKWTIENNIVSAAKMIADATTKSDYVFSNNNYYGTSFYIDEAASNWAGWQGVGWDADVGGNPVSFANQNPKVRSSDLAITNLSPTAVKSGGTPVEGVTVISGVGQLGIDGKTFSVVNPSMGAYAGTVFLGGGTNLGLGLSGGNYRPRR